MAIKDNLQPFWGFNVQGITKDDGSANDAFISSLQSELDKTELDLYSSKLETYLDTANGRWLDYWGRWLGLHRDNRSDDDYRTALINHVLHERNTIPALTKALSDFLKINQDHIYIYEPWRDMFVWNASHYNTHKFFTDPYYRYAVIDIQIEGPYSDIVNEIINLFRPAGVYWVVTSLVNVINNTAPILDLSLPTTQIIESADTDYANFTQTNSAYLNSKLDLATYVGDPFNYNKDNLNAGKQYATSNSSYNPVVYIGSNKGEYGITLDTTSQDLKQQLGIQITTQPTVISSIDSQSSSFTVDQTQTSLLGGVDLLGYLTVYEQAVKLSDQTAKQFILANLANSNTQRLELVLQNQANIDLTQDVRLELYDYNLHLWIKPIIEYEVHSDYTIFKVSLSSIAPYLSAGGNFMFQVWPTVANITTLSVNYLGYLFNAPSDIITLANSAETFTIETN